MNIIESRYSQFALCKEMYDTIEIVKQFNQAESFDFVDFIKVNEKLLITGEGSSRIFPAKHFIYKSLAEGVKFEPITDGCLQATEYNLNHYCVIGISNSGKTKELINLFNNLKKSEHNSYLGISSTEGTPIATLPVKSAILNCGKEQAVAATKSVVEQALFMQSLLYNYLGIVMPDLNLLAAQINETLDLNISPSIIEKVRKAPMIYFSGRNNGVAEELTLKTNEIIRKKSVYLEGTYALHGIEEVMNPGEVMIIIEPFIQEEQKFKEVLADGVGIEIIAISSRDTCFPTIKIPNGFDYRNYIELVAGWNLLVETGIELGINLDKPVRARKIGNEVF